MQMSKSGDECEPKENDKCIAMAENGHENVNEQQDEQKNKLSMRLRTNVNNSIQNAKTVIDQRYKIIIFILTLLLLSFLLVIIILSFTIKSENNIDNNYCSTSTCLKSASLLVDSLNTTLDPCINIYEYSCDGWLNRHQLPLNKGHYRIDDKIRRRLNKELRYYIDLIPNQDSNLYTSKVKRFYDSCIDARSQDIKYFLDSITEKLNGWYLLDQSVLSTWDFSRAVIKYIETYDVEAFFRLSIDIDHLSSQTPIIKIEPAELGLPVEYYFEPQYKPFVDAYKTYLEEFLKQIGKTAQMAKTFAEDMFSFEKRIAEFTPLPHLWVNGTQIYKKYRLRDLNSIIKRIEFLDVLQIYFKDANVNDKTIVLVAFDDYFRQLSNLITTADSKTLNNYLVWRLAMKFMRYLPKEYITLHNEFTQMMNGVEKPYTSDYDERWELCVETTSDFFNLAVTDLYLQHQSDYKYIKSDIEDMINNITKTLISSIPNYKWIRDQQTESKAIEKIQNMLIDIFIPKMYTQQALATYYRLMDVRKIFFNNIERAISFRRLKKVDILKNKLPIDWPSKHILDVNSVYSYSGNHLYIAAGLFHPPLYELNYPLSIKYGSVGFAIASQLMNALSIDGIEYNEKGHLSSMTSEDPVSWISMNSKNTLKSNAECLEQVFNNKFSNTLIDPRLIISQTYADIGALKLVFDTYKRLEEENGKQVILPGVKATGDQLLFISFAQSQCESMRPRYKVAKYSSLRTLPGKQRVEEAFLNIKSYSDAFSCSSKPEPKCTLW